MEKQNSEKTNVSKLKNEKRRRNLEKWKSMVAEDEMNIKEKLMEKYRKWER